MTIKNLTPHNICVLAKSCATPVKGGKFEADPTALQVLKTFPSEGVARVTSTSVDCAPIEDIPTVAMSFGDPIDLPAPAEGTFLIVSSLLASSPACRGRKDLLVPAQPVVDKGNPSNMLGCLALSRVNG